MNMMNTFSVKVGVALFFCLIIFSGCYTKETVKNISDEETLRESGSRYWGHVCRQEFDKAYEFEYPVYRKAVSAVNYIRRFRPNVTWIKATIEKIEVESENETAMMTVIVETDINMRVPKIAKKVEISPKVALNEKWVKVDGVWYHVPPQFIEETTGKKI